MVGGGREDGQAVQVIVHLERRNHLIGQHIGSAQNWTECTPMRHPHNVQILSRICFQSLSNSAPNGCRNSDNHMRLGLPCL